MLTWPSDGPVHRSVFGNSSRRRTSDSAEPRGRHPGRKQGGFHASKDRRTFLRDQHCVCCVGRQRQRSEFTGHRGTGHSASRRRRAQGRARHRRAGHGSQGRHLSRRVRRGRRVDRTPARGRLDVPHRVDDQADHVVRADAACRAGQARPRRPGVEVPAGAGQPPGDRVVRHGNRRVQAAPRVAAGHGPALPDPHIGPCLCRSPAPPGAT